MQSLTGLSAGFSEDAKTVAPLPQQCFCLGPMFRMGCHKPVACAKFHQFGVESTDIHHSCNTTRKAQHMYRHTIALASVILALPMLFISCTAGQEAIQASPGSERVMQGLSAPDIKGPRTVREVPRPCPTGQTCDSNPR